MARGSAGLWWGGAGPQGSRPPGARPREPLWGWPITRVEPFGSERQSLDPLEPRRAGQWALERAVVSVGRCGPVNGLGGGAVRGLWGGPAGLELGGPSSRQHQGEAGPLCTLEVASYLGVGWGSSGPGLGGPPASSPVGSLCLCSHPLRGSVAEFQRDHKRGGAACSASPRPGEWRVAPGELSH